MVLISGFQLKFFLPTGPNTRWVFFPDSLRGDRPVNTLFWLLKTRGAN